MDPPGDTAGSAAQRAMLVPSTSPSTAPPHLPEYHVPGTVKPILNYSIQTGEEFALEFTRDSAMSQKHLGTSGDQNAATSGYMDLRGMLGASHTASETGQDIFMLTPIVDPRQKESERKPVTQVQNRSRHSSTRSVPRALSGDGSSQGLSHGYASSEASDTYRRIKFMCTFGGKILPRPSDGKLRYVGGETRIIRISKDISWQELRQKTLAIFNQPHIIKYQLPGEDLDSLVLVSSDEDLTNMMDEFAMIESEGGPQKRRVFLISSLDFDDNRLSKSDDSGAQFLIPQSQPGAARKFIAEAADSVEGVENLNSGAPSLNLNEPSSDDCLVQFEKNFWSTTRAVVESESTAAHSENIDIFVDINDRLPPDILSDFFAKDEFPNKNNDQRLVKIDEGVYTFRADHDAISMKGLYPNYNFDAEKKAEPSIIVADVSSMPPAYASSHIDHQPKMERSVDAFQVDNPYAPMGDNTNSPAPDFEEPKFKEDRTAAQVMDASLRDSDFEHLQIIKNEDLNELRELGSGTFGTVYHGKWRGTDVAIKRIKKSCFTGRSSEQERLAQEFWREAEILSKLHHPNVVVFYGVMKDGPGGTLAILTEFMVNGSLRHVLQRKDKCPDLRKRLIIAMDAAFGMEYLHSKKIVHFDLKCDNLLVNLRDHARPICKVGDFGLSKIKRNTLVLGGVRGTLPWMAPELLNGSSSKVSEKVDVFSFGIVLWEILTGEEPYANMHYGAIIGGIVNNTLRPPVPANCGPEWRRLMEQCWSPDPAQRPAFTEIAARLQSMSAAANQQGKPFLMGITGQKVLQAPADAPVEWVPMRDGVLLDVEVMQVLTPEMATPAPDHAASAPASVLAPDSLPTTTPRPMWPPPKTETMLSKLEISKEMDMELSPISASLGAMGSLPRKLHELLATKHWALRGVLMDEIHHLTADLCILYSFMLKLSDAPQDPPMAARYWMKDVRELSYDMEDFADQFVHAHGRAKIPRATCRKNKTISRVKIDRLPKRRKWPPGITHKIPEFRSRAREAIQRYWRYKFDDCASNPRYSRIGRGCPTILPDDDDLVGIEGPTDELERWLINGEEQLKVVSIVGVAGMGKTTLALRLWGMLRGQFECGAFVRTAQKPNMRGILRDILLQVRPNQPPNHGEMRHLINDLREYLQDKRYFVIIDDLWATSVWDVVSRAFPKSGCSRIITTTEIMEVALACCGICPEHIYKMESLSDNDSEKLLLQRIIVSGNQSPQQFEDVIPQIIRSCGGLPLAIIIVARILASQPEKLVQWGSAQNLFDTIFGAKLTMEGFMRHILNICFINLPHYLKTCLLYLSTYPEGYLFLKDDLVQQWVAEGFICANKGTDMEEVAKSFFDELVSIGLIQLMDINNDYELLSYSVHQLVLDLITYKSIEENFITVVDYSQTTISLPDKVWRLSLHFGSATYATAPESTGLSQVRSLFFSGLFNCMPSFMVFKLLRVLILHFSDDTGTKTLNLTRICELFWLRYLQVTCNVTVKLPDKIEAIKHLETLEINARVLDVPSDIVTLSSLLHLRLRGANLPNGIGRIRSLRMLMYFDLGNSSEDNLWGLGELTNLRDLHLTYSSLHSSEHLERNLKALASSLGKLCNLKSLTLAPDTVGTVVLFDCSGSMSTPIFLERLELPPIFIFSRLPKWIGQLHKICIMKVAVRELPTIDIAILTGLPSLTVLSLSIQTAPEGRIVFKDREFPVLKYFKFRCGVLCIHFLAGAMPNLRRLKLSFNTHVGEKYDNMLAGIENLLNLHDIAGKIGATTESEWRAAESAINNAINKHPRFPRRNLQWVDPVEEKCCPSEKHHLRQEKVLVGEKHGVLEKANNMNKHADTGLYQPPNLPSIVASGRLKSGSLVEELQELSAPSLPCKVNCPLCKETIQQEILDLHNSEQCTQRLLVCQYCEYQLPAIELHEHQAVCVLATVFCETCKKNIRYREWLGHEMQCYDSNDSAELSRLPQLPDLPSTVTSGHLLSGMVPQESKNESPAPSWPPKVWRSAEHQIWMPYGGEADSFAVTECRHAHTLILKILGAAVTARQNRLECENLAQCLHEINALFPNLRLDREMAQPLAKLNHRLIEAHELVAACQSWKFIFSRGVNAELLRDVKRRILEFHMFVKEEERLWAKENTR
ncbi:hypothetical protein ACQJBY_039302 [Aegilops geniculata]